MIRSQTCPICDAELPPELTADSPYFPFCSKRCQLIDLGRWADGRYAIVDEMTPEQMAEEFDKQNESGYFEG